MCLRCPWMEFTHRFQYDPCCEKSLQEWLASRRSAEGEMGHSGHQGCVGSSQTLKGSNLCLGCGWWLSIKKGMQRATHLIIFWIYMDSFNFLESCLLGITKSARSSPWVNECLGVFKFQFVCLLQALGAAGLKLSVLLNPSYQVNGMKNVAGHPSEYNFRALTI